MIDLEDPDADQRIAEAKVSRPAPRTTYWATPCPAAAARVSSA